MRLLLISNSTNAGEAYLDYPKHEIKDLFVGIQVTNVNIFGVSKGNVTLVGRRGKMSYKEWCSHYSHSHLGSSYNSWQTFCLGNSDIAMLINELKLSFDKDMWYMLFYALPNYVNWESLEGGPYKKIEIVRYSVNNAEFNTLIDLQNYCRLNPNGSVLYFHTKGISHINSAKLCSYSEIYE